MIFLINEIILHTLFPCDKHTLVKLLNNKKGTHTRALEDNIYFIARL